jgi:hypothetical protein
MLCGPVWVAAGAPDGDLCVGCVEARLGRPLVPADFAVVAVNEPHPWQSVRLVSRLVGVSEEALAGWWPPQAGTNRAREQDSVGAPSRNE